MFKRPAVHTRKIRSITNSKRTLKGHNSFQNLAVFLQWKYSKLKLEQVAIVMEIAEVIERGRKDKLPALRNVPKKKLLEETAKVDKVLSKF